MITLPTESEKSSRIRMTLNGEVTDVSFAPYKTLLEVLRHMDGLRAEAIEARRDGFTAKMAIHPAQVAIINEVFTPDKALVAEARERVLGWEPAVELDEGLARTLEWCRAMGRPA